MIESGLLKSRLSIYDNNLCSCNVCGEKIPKYIQRIDFGIRGYRGAIRYIRVCELCILRLSVYVNREQIEKWREELLIKQV